MTKINLGLNIVLLAAVCFLGWKHYNLEKQARYSHEESRQSGQAQFMLQGMLDQLPAFVEEVAREEAKKVFSEMNEDAPPIEKSKLKELLFEGIEPLDLNNFFDYTPNNAKNIT